MIIHTPSKMVCFSQSSYEFNDKNAFHWVKLLEKYLNGIGVTITASGAGISKQQVKFTGKVGSQELLKYIDKCVEQCAASSSDCHFVLETEKFWDEYCCVSSLPTFVKGDSFKINEDQVKFTQLALSDKLLDNVTGVVLDYVRLSDNVKSVCSAIDSIIESRKSLGGREVFIRLEFQNGLSFNNVVAALQSTDTNCVTKAIVAGTTEVVYLIVEKYHSLCLTKECICDGHLPTLDFDDGFVTGQHYLPEFDFAFKQWKEKFQSSNGATWNNPIFPSTICFVPTS